MPDLPLLFLPPPGRVIIRERRRIKRALRRAKLSKLPFTLTIHEWLNTLNVYGWRCALCRGPFETLEHVLPLSEGGGTTVENCVPCCKYCNSSRDRVSHAVAILRIAQMNGRLYVFKDIVLRGVELLFGKPIS